MQKTEKILVQGIKSKIITQNDDLLAILQKTLKRFPPREKDVVVISSKVLAVTQGRVREINSKQDFADLVKNEADEIIGEGAVTLTLKNGIFIPWSGIDRSNIQKGLAVLWPEKPFESAQKICGFIKKKFKLKKLGVIISDSHCIPLRKGVIGLALGYAGFKGVRDLRGKKDIYGNILNFTQQNHADMLASAAHLVTGEADEQTPFAIIRNAPVDFTSSRSDPREMLMKKNEDLFAPLIDFKLK
jgi:coenzyme F420-0:L-glutamate ligase